MQRVGGKGWWMEHLQNDRSRFFLQFYQTVFLHVPNILHCLVEAHPDKLRRIGLDSPRRVWREKSRGVSRGMSGNGVCCFVSCSVRVVTSSQSSLAKQSTVLTRSHVIHGSAPARPRLLIVKESSGKDDAGGVKLRCHRVA